MSVLCCRVPHLLIALACRRAPELADRPLALLGPDERVWAASPEAQRGGVGVQMRAREAAIACPDLLLHALDVAVAEAEQGALLAELAEWQLPVEPLGWGGAYVDLHAIAESAAGVQPLAAELGRRLRRTLGPDLQPAIGWDSGKFTASAAAAHTPPGRMRLVEGCDEMRFLRPLPVGLLPLPRPHLQQLHWLGVRTLGEFAALPATGVMQRFGPAGRQAQRWAQGHDDRPVAGSVSAPPEPVTVALEPPARTLQPVVEAVMTSLRPLLAERAARLEGVRRLRLTAVFVAGADQSTELVFVEAASGVERMQAAVMQGLCRLRWPSEVEAVRWALLETGELLAPQLGLYADAAQRYDGLSALAQTLAVGHGGSLFQAAVAQATHPVPERRGALLPLLEHVTDVAPVA